MGRNKNLHSAKSAKNDEFYTQLSDIENELRNYKEFFKGKTVLLPCDDPELIPCLVKKNKPTIESASQF